MGVENFKPRIVAFCCENSALLAAGLAKQYGMTYPADVDIIALPCSGKIDVLHLMKALEKGADGTIILACQKDNCQFLRGNSRAAQRVDQACRLLHEVGIEQERVAIAYIAANQGNQFAEIVQDMAHKLKEIGPNPGKVRK